jgi:prepilin-type processing-associated H-X9-DG protein
VQVEATYALPLKLALRKGDDGNWRVAVRGSVQNTTGAAEPTLLRGGPLFGDAGMRVQEACQANLKQLMLAVLMYAQDHDEVLPSAETWRDDIMPYIGNVQVFQCFVNPWGYTYNASLSKKPLGQVDRPSETIVLFEVGHMEPNAAADLTAVQLAHRHNGGDNVAYADGHVKWLPGQ